MDVVILLCNVDRESPFEKVLGKTVLQYALDSVRGYRVVVGTDLPPACFGDLTPPPTLVHIKRPLEGHGCLGALTDTLTAANVTGPCLVTPYDTFFGEDVAGTCAATTCNAVVYVERTEHSPLTPPRGTCVSFDDGGHVTDLHERERVSAHSCTGAFYFQDGQALRRYCESAVGQGTLLPVTTRECGVGAVVTTMLRGGERFHPVRVSPELFFPLGTPELVQRYVDRTFAFLYDLDGTLVLTDDLYFEVWKELLSPYRIDLTREVFGEVVHSRSDADVLSRLLCGFAHDVHEMAQRKDSLFCERMDRLGVVRGAVDFVRRQKWAGHKTAVVTNCNRLVAERTLDFLNLSSDIDRLVIGGECPRAKPYPDPYVQAVRHFSIETSKCIVFEDSINGVLSGNGISPWKTVGLTTTNEAAVLLNHGADVVFNDFAEIDAEGLMAVATAQDHDIKELLQRKFPGKAIGVEVGKLKGGFIADVVSVTVGGKPCVVKIVSRHSNPLRDMATALDLYETEYLFYDRFSDIVPVKVPAYHGRLYGENYDCLGIVLEDLRKPSFVLNVDLNAEPVDTSLAIVDAIAEMHAKFWGKGLANKFAGLKRNNTRAFDWASFLQGKIDAFLSKWSHMMVQDDRDYFAGVTREFRAIQERLSSEPLTLCHGDVKSPNIFFERRPNGRSVPYFLDWQYVVEGKGVQDLVFFMIESFSTIRIETYFPMLKAFYYVKLMEHGVVRYSLEEFEADFRAAAHYFPLFVAVWFGTVPEEELIDRNFPTFFLQRLLSFYRLMNTSTKPH